MRSNMKRIIYLLIPVLIALTVLSCKRDYDDDYMGSVDERLNATLTAYQNGRRPSTVGWPIFPPVRAFTVSG